MEIKIFSNFIKSFNSSVIGFKFILMKTAWHFHILFLVQDFPCICLFVFSFWFRIFLVFIFFGFSFLLRIFLIFFSFIYSFWFRIFLIFFFFFFLNSLFGSGFSSYFFFFIFSFWLGNACIFVFSYSHFCSAFS